MSEPQTVAAVPPLKQPTQLPEDALAYWRVVLAGVEQANRELAEMQQLEQRIVQLKQAATAKIGAYESYTQHLCARFGLDGPTTRIDPDGHITYMSPENGTA